VTGELYGYAADIRDTGVPIAEARGKVFNPVSQMALEQVYQNQGMSREQWRWFAMGVCMGIQSKPFNTVTR
jgi:hypothetical protein